MKALNEYERENGILRGKVIQQNEELKRYKAGNAPQVIEIHDDTVGKNVEFGGF